jgi:hypothetical protein
MASLKAFLSGVAPILNVTPAALYERQRALVTLGVLKPTKGRGRGSGVLLTADNFAAVLISMLVTDSLSEVDERVVALINAPPRSKDRNGWVKAGRPTFCSSVAAVLAGEEELPWPIDHPVFEIRVVRYRTGILSGFPGASRTEYSAKFNPSHIASISHIEISAAINSRVLNSLTTFTQGALTQTKAEEDEE